MENKKEKNQNKLKFKVGKYSIERNKAAAFSTFILAVIFIFYNDKHKRKLLFELISNKRFTFSLLIAFIFSVYTLYFVDDSIDSQKLTTATKHAIIGFLIGILHHFDFKIGPFWFIWLVSYYLDMSE